SALGVDFNLEEHFRKQKMIAGTSPRAHDEILIDPITAEQLQASVGDVLEVQRFGDPVSLKVAGIYDRPRLGAVQRPQIDLDLHTLADAADRQGQLTSIWIILKKGVDKEAFCARHQAEVPDVLVLEPAEMVRTGFDRQVLASQFGFTIASVLTFI